MTQQTDIPETEEVAAARTRIGAAIARLPSERDVRGQLFLAKLLDKEGPESVIRFLNKVAYINARSEKLKGADFTDTQIELLKTIRLRGMPRRRALETMGVSGFIFGFGVHDTLQPSGDDRYKGTTMHRLPVVGVFELALGALGVAVGAMDDLLQQRLEAVALAVDVFVQHNPAVVVGR